MTRVLLATLTFVAATIATPATAVTTVVSFSSASCSTACGDRSLIAQSFGDTADVDLTYRGAANVGNSSTVVGSLLYWSNNYSNSPAAYSGASGAIGEVRFDVQSAGTLTLDSVDFGGWSNTPRTIAWRVYDLGFNLLSNGSVTTNATALTTIAFGNTSTAGLIFQFGPDGFNGGIQNLTYSFEPGVVPEPASWAMLIAGFGLVGATMRRRRAAIA